MCQRYRTFGRLTVCSIVCHSFFYMHILYGHVIGGGKTFICYCRCNRNVCFTICRFHHTLIRINFINGMPVRSILFCSHRRINSVLQLGARRFQLGHVHRIRRFRTGCYVGNLAGLSVTAYRKRCKGRFPDGIALGG